MGVVIIHYIITAVLDRMKPVSLSSFRDHVASMHEDRDKGFETEYQVRKEERNIQLVRVDCCVLFISSHLAPTLSTTMMSPNYPLIGQRTDLPTSSHVSHQC